MFNARNCLVISLCLLMITYTLTPLASAEIAVNPKDLNELEKENEELRALTENLIHRLKRLEPAKPKNIQDPPWGELQFPTKTFPIEEVIETGIKIPSKTIVDNPNYKRPAYEAHWHSEVGRWSYVPNRIHFALHRLFINYDIGLSGWYDFEHNTGLTIPIFQDEEALDLYIVAFQTQVTNVFTKGNQVVVEGNPKRNGVQVITITTKDLNPIDEKDNILVQLVTQDGHEMDYSLISYVKPDFWAKQKEKLKERD